MVTFQELATFCGMNDWKLTGRDAVVKVVSVMYAGEMLRAGFAKGYVTQAKFLKGLNATQIETRLGVPPFSLRGGAYVLYFAELPDANTVDQRYYASMPAGRIWDHNLDMGKYLTARDERDASGSDVIRFYPPGSSSILQWELHTPVRLAHHWKIITPSMPFQV